MSCIKLTERGNLTGRLQALLEGRKATGARGAHT